MLVLVKMNGLAHFTTFNNANRRQMERGDEERYDDCDDDPDEHNKESNVPPPMAVDSIDEIAVDSVVMVSEETLLDGAISDAIYEIVSENGCRAALIANVLLRRAEAHDAQASLRVRIAAEQVCKFKETVVSFLAVTEQEHTNTKTDLTIRKK